MLLDEIIIIQMLFVGHNARAEKHPCKAEVKKRIHRNHDENERGRRQKENVHRLSQCCGKRD